MAATCPTFPPELVEEVLKNRPVYLVVSQEASYDFTPAKTLGIFFRYDNAVKCVLQDVFKNLHYDSYDPARRFKYRKSYRMFAEPGEMEWEDSWECYVGVGHYHVEEWRPEVAGRVSRKSLAFDAWLKNKIIKENISSGDLRQQLDTWKDALKSGDVPEELNATMVEGERKRGSNNFEGSREEWIARHGSLTSSY